MKKLFFIINCITLITLISCKKSNSSGTPPPIQTQYLDMSYASTSSAQKLDIFLPDRVKTQNPVLVWIHGGGWKNGDKAEFRNSNRLTELKRRGYAVIVINYRLSGEAKFPAQIYDVKAAIRWIKANAVTYKFNPDKIAVWGSSAGGHLSQGCSSSTHNSANSPESELIGYQITTRPDLVTKVNPITYITADDPPFFIEHGLIDCTVVNGQSQLLYDKLMSVLGTQKLKIKFLANSGHGGGLFGDPATDTEAIDFLDLYLK